MLPTMRTGMPTREIAPGATPYSREYEVELTDCHGHITKLVCIAVSLRSALEYIEAEYRGWQVSGIWQRG